MDILIYLFIILIISSIPILIHFLKKPNHNASMKDLYAEGLDMLVVGKRKSAYRIFKKIIQHDSNNVKAYLHLGQVVREGGNPKKALEIHQNLLHRKNLNNYDKIQLYKNIALDYLKLNNIDKSIEYSSNVLLFTAQKGLGVVDLSLFPSPAASSIRNKLIFFSNYIIFVINISYYLLNDSYH